MRLYSGMSEQFIQDTIHNRIAEKLKDAFFRQYRYRPSPSEVGSWRNSLRAVSQVFDDAGLRDHGVILEYQLPLTSKRLDCMICGHDDDDRDAAVVIELKQWESCMPTDGDNLVCTRLGGAERDVLHPSAQVGQYQQYLEDTHTAFHEKPEPIRVRSCAYLHNYTAEPDDVLFDGKFSSLLTRYPTFTADDVDPLKDYLSEQIRGGDGHPVLRRIEQSRYRPSKKLMEHVGNVIKGQPEYVLLDDQLVVYDKVRALARKGFDDRRKTVLIVQGGPGTGKSVIAVNLMSDLLLSGSNAHYATGSRAFTEVMRKIIGSRGSVQFKYFNSYREAEVNAVDVLICDEAHRIREFSRDRFTPRAEGSETPQIDELIHASKLGVFFVDDRQRVRPDEIGSSEHIREHARQGGCQVLEYRLEAQFRCSGSDAFVNWVDNTLGIEHTANVLWEGDEQFDFRIYASPEELDAAIRARVDDGHSARMTAGFCWKWSAPKPDRTLVEDVVIGAYRRPWNAKPNAGRLAHGIPKATLWAHDPNGIAQVGCIYTAQGFEFDYAGVIFGPDLTYDFDSQAWKGNPVRSHDRTVKSGGERFTDLVKNTYRVLLSRGLKGCYVHFMDKDTERFFRSRMEAATGKVDDARGRRVADAGPPHFEPDEPGS